VTTSITIDVPLNRVEGDLEIRARIDDGVVTEAWAAGTMFRGFETILRGRAAMDGLVITPRICGICGTAHLTAASLALDAVSGAKPPPDAVRVRNASLMTEHFQSDIRHGLLMFAVDFANPAYAKHSLYEQAVRRYQPFAGSSVVAALRSTKKILEVIAILGGQWPHSAYMVPGGVACVPSPMDLLLCRQILEQARLWYESQVLGCTVERWLRVDSASALDAWLDESPAHAESDVGFLLRFGREAGLDKTGAGHGNFLSFGSLPIPEGSSVHGAGGSPLLMPSGFVHGALAEPFDQAEIVEHVAHSWFEDYAGGKHPFHGETKPYATGRDGTKYSWAKAPRYRRKPSETGPLAEALIAGSPLFVDLLAKSGPSTLTRQLARLVRPTTLLAPLETWLKETTGERGFLLDPGPIRDGEGFGTTEASRGALGHWVKVEDGLITHYQVITPTAWHASPRDSENVPGPMEQALVGTRVADPENPVELGHVIRSFDACLVCTVHTIGKDDRPLGRATVGGSP
jgi:hydrogenase large subunit